jgi:glycosyltransferase involved in cell wall biosynthesis
MSLTILIPIRNEEIGILDTLKYFENSWVTDIEHEIILVDDFSTDNTHSKIQQFQSSKLNYKIIKNKKNGLGSAMTVGIENSNKEFITIFMADLSDNIDDLKTYYQLINDKKLNAVFG